MARRLAERGVRFIQVYCDGEWDAHGDVRDNHAKQCRQMDGPVAGLLVDLKRRGLLDSTLVVWGGEFGRMPVSEKGKGRDHNPHGFLTWFAGGGVRGGTSHGATDDVGLKAVEGRTSVHDLHATVLHLLGLDHKRLTYLHNGRRFRLTDVAGEVIRPILNESAS
jgi:arylsulfatase A-like enzyme